MNADLENNIFLKCVPTAFIVSSPLQLLCAIEAIHEFDISKYKIVLVLPQNGPRNQQLLSMADNYLLEYDKVYYNIVSYNDYKSGKGFFSKKSKEQYDRIFIGDYQQVELYYVAYKYSSPNCYLFYGDDGNDSISYFQNKSLDPTPTRLNHRILYVLFGLGKREQGRLDVKREMTEKGLTCTSSFFTSFYNIKNNLFNIYPNNFRYLSSLNTKRTENIVVIIGSILNYIPEINHISEKCAEEIFKRKFFEVKKKYPDTKVIYIPHGRDTSITIKELCLNFDIEYRKIPETIEGYLLKSDYYPIAIYGEGSTALYNLKLLYPNSKVVSWFFDKKFDNPKYIIEKRIADYYMSNGIDIDCIKYKITTSSYVRFIFDNLFGMLVLPFQIAKLIYQKHLA